MPIDDRVVALQSSRLHLTRSSWHLCLPGHGNQVLPGTTGDEPEATALWSPSHRLTASRQSRGQSRSGTLHLLVVRHFLNSNGIDRTRRSSAAQSVEEASRKTAWKFLEDLIEDFPGKFKQSCPNCISARSDMMCEDADLSAIAQGAMRSRLEHRLIKPKPAWSSPDPATHQPITSQTDRKVGGLRRTPKDGGGVGRTIQRINRRQSVKLYRNEPPSFARIWPTSPRVGGIDPSSRSNCSCARLLMTLRRHAPQEHIRKICPSEPDMTIVKPIHQMPGPYSWNSVIPRQGGGGHLSRPSGCLRPAIEG